MKRLGTYRQVPITAYRLMFDLGLCVYTLYQNVIAKPSL